MPKVFIDSSVLIAAILSNCGGSAIILRQGRDKKIITIISESVFEEILSKALKINKSSLEITDFISKHSIFIRKNDSTDKVSEFSNFVSDPKDIHVIAGAKLSNCDYLVTLDKKHLLNPQVKKAVKPLKTVSPKRFLRELV